MILLEIFDYNWFENHFLYFAGVAGVYVFYLIIKLLWKIDKDIKNMNKKSKEGMIDYIRKTSEYNKDNKPKKLSFDEED